MRQKNYLMILVTVITAIVFNLVGWPFGLRFTYTPLNYWIALFLCIALPVSAFSVAIGFSSKAVRIFCICVSLLIAVPSVLVSFFIGVEAVNVQRTNTDSSFELLHQISVGRSTYRLYRTNCGATCSFGLNLRREIDTSFGVKFVRSVWSKYREDTGKLVLVSGNELQIVGEVRVLGAVPL